LLFSQEQVQKLVAAIVIFICDYALPILLTASAHDVGACPTQKTYPASGLWLSFSLLVLDHHIEV
jgi:hypothetical protein